MRVSDKYIEKGNQIINVLKENMNREIKHYATKTFCENVLPALIGGCGVWVIALIIAIAAIMPIPWFSLCLVIAASYPYSNYVFKLIDNWWQKKLDFELDKNLELSESADIIWNSLNPKISEALSYDLFCEDEYLFENIVKPLRAKNLSEESIIVICDYIRDKTIKGDFKSAVKYINENFGVDIK